MNSFLTIISTKRAGNILALSILLIYIILAFTRLYPFENTLNKILLDRDDWCRYAQFALDIKHNGIWMPSVSEAYQTPAGFFYCYFIALCFYLFGENTVPVFFIQSIMLGISVLFIYLAFRDKMKPLISVAFLVAMFIFSLLDIYKYYSFRLLSENFALFTMSFFFLCFIKFMENKKLFLFIFSAVLLGISILTRPNIFPFAIVLIIFLLYDAINKKQGFQHLFLFILFLGIILSFIGFRNYFVTGHWIFFPVEGVSMIGYHYQEKDIVMHYLKKIIFCFGFLTPLEPDFLWRPHWILMWAGYFTYLFFKISDKNKFKMWEITCHLYVFIYYSFLILVAPIGSYGFRMLIPATFIVLAFSFMGLELLIQKINTAYLQRNIHKVTKIF